MEAAAKNLDFITAAKLRDEIVALKGKNFKKIAFSGTLLQLWNKTLNITFYGMLKKTRFLKFKIHIGS